MSMNQEQLAEKLGKLEAIRRSLEVIYNTKRLDDRKDDVKK